jgi:stearoyl-CoA desaturase (delta-9 desaturase)
LHVAAVAVLWVGWSWAALGFCLLLYLLRMFAITGFYHRYFSHRTFRTSRAFQALMAVWGLTAMQRGPLWWASHHRHHHRHSDEPCDLHSPRHHGFFWAHMGWVTSAEALHPDLDSVRDLSRYPELDWLDRYPMAVYIPFGLACWGYGVAASHYAPWLQLTGAQAFVWGFIISTLLLYHGTYTINSLSHVFGSQRFVTGDDSRNNWLLSLITLGEGWHNNHHHYPGSVRQGFAWWEIDITYYGLLVLRAWGLIWELNPVPEKVLLQVKGSVPARISEC